MLKRLQKSSLNLLVLGASVAVFLLAFFVLQGFVSARTPELAGILVAARSIQIGETIRPADLVERQVYRDETTDFYFQAGEAPELIGALAALPISAGQPVLRENLISAASTASRFSALLSEFPNHSLFPLPLDASNIVAPPIDIFLPGDLVGITVVISNRPQVAATPADDSFSFTIPGAPEDVISDGLPNLVPTAYPEDVDPNSLPPLAKDLFPGGVRVVAIQGLPQPANPDDPAPAFNSFQSSEMLILLIEDSGREMISLALQQGDLIFVSFLGHLSAAESTDGFTYWDFEAWFQADRQQP